MYRAPTTDERDCTTSCVLLQGDYDFSARVLAGQVAESFGGIAQVVTSVDHRGYFSGLHQIAQDGQVLLVGFGNNKDELLAHEP